MNKEKIEKILNVKRPTTLRQLRGFLGMASYYRRYIKNFSRVAAPLIALTKKEEEYEWVTIGQGNNRPSRSSRHAYPRSRSSHCLVRTSPSS